MVSSLFPKATLMLVIEEFTSPAAHFLHCESPFSVIGVLS